MGMIQPPEPDLTTAIKTVHDFLNKQDHAGFMEMEAWRRINKELAKVPAAREALDTASVPLGMSVMRFWDHKIIEVRRILSEGLVQPTGVCYCGTDMKDHRGWEGHTPVEMPTPEVPE